MLQTITLPGAPDSNAVSAMVSIAARNMATTHRSRSRGVVEVTGASP